MNPKTRLKKKGDKIWFEKLLKPHCEICGKKALQVHHFYYKSSYGYLRYDKDNGISLCLGCHFVLHHQDPHRIEDKIIAGRGKKWLAELKKKAYNRPEGSYLTMKWVREQIKELEK